MSVSRRTPRDERRRRLGQNFLRLEIVDRIVAEADFRFGELVIEVGAILVNDLRRSAIRSMINAHVDEQIAMRISGHKTVSVFRRYRIVTKEAVRPR